MQPILRTTEDYSWVFIVILGIGTLLVLMKFLFYKSFSSIDSFKNFIKVEDNSLSLALYTNLLFGILIGTALYPYIEIPYEFIKSEWVSISIFIILWCIYILIKFLANAIICRFNLDRTEFRNIIRGNTYIRFYAVIVFIIFSFLIYYSGIDKKLLLYAILGTSSIIFLFEYYLQLNHTELNRFIKSYYFILYLCILEILPVLYIYNHWYR